MLNKLVYILVLIGRKLLTFGPPGRNIEVINDDIYIVSYPKSGNTWVRFMIGNLYSKKNAVTFSNLEEKVPDIYQNPARSLKKLMRPRILKSHEYLDPRYGKVIYIVRDPRDVAVSYYHYLIKMRIITEDYPMITYIDRFIRGELDTFGSWHDHVGGWIGARRHRCDFLLLFYEEMLDNPVEELKKIAEFLECPATDEQLKTAVALSSSDHMRILEQQEAGQWTPIKTSRTDKLFVRKATKGSWKTELPEDASGKIEHVWSDLMLDIGYSIKEIRTSAS